MKSFFRGSAVLAATLLASSFLFTAIPSVAETPLPPQNPQKQSPDQTARPESRERIVSDKTEGKSVAETAATSGPANLTGVVPPVSTATSGITTGTASNSQPALPATYTATAYSLGGRTASGQPVAKGLIAADPSVLPLGTRVRLDAGTYSGEYLVADTGGAVRGKRIDIWTPNSHEANRFGRRMVKLTVLSYPVKRKAPRKARG
jgi:3D (Asp-Asp-Asp) domain-containing protein